MKLKYFLLLIFITLTYCQSALGNIEGPVIGKSSAIDWAKELDKHDVPLYGYKIIRSYPHDNRSFTQGLLIYQNILYESSGLYHQSKLRKVNMVNGELIQEFILPSQYFAEGIAIIGNNLYQLTYESNVGFVYDAKTLKLKTTFHYPTQGWGLTSNNKELILSNGSSSLLFLDPIHFNITRFVIVHHNNTVIGPINELEYVKGKIYANIYGTEIIALINPSDGKIEGWVDLHGIYEIPKEFAWLEVLNGIAYDKSDDTFIVTGKLWPNLYKIKIVKKNR